MIPWPIALLTLCYGVIATVSAASLWRIVEGRSDQPAIWPLAWLVVSAGAMCGLPLLKPWGMRLAIVGLVLIMGVILARAGLLVMAGAPLAGLLTSVGAGVPVLVIRFIQRPTLQAYFEQSGTGKTHQTANQ